MTDEPKLPAGLKPGDLVVVLERNGSSIPLGVPLSVAPANPNIVGHGDFGVRHPNGFIVRNFHSDREGTEWKRADPGVRRFRTITENAICMGAPVGTKFTLRDGSSRVEFDDFGLPSCMECPCPDEFVRQGEIEELGTQPDTAAPEFGEPRWTPELLAECRNEAGTPFNKMSPAAQALLKAVSPTHDPENPQPKETKMTPIKIETATLVNGTRADSYSAAARSELLQRYEAEIKRMEALEFKTQETKDEIAALRAGVEAAIKAFDEDYAKRKAAKNEA